MTPGETRLLQNPGKSAVKRKIAAILAADIVGYSRLVRDDEEETLHRLDGCRAVWSDCIARFGGRVVDMAGDSILAEFQTAIDAVRCAVDAQESLRSRNLDCPPGRKMDYRIGITMGDVLERDGFLLGDGVNIASRLQAIAPAGGICISRSIYEAVAHKILLKFVDAGQQQLKNIPDTVHAYTAALDQRERIRESLPEFNSLVRPAAWGALTIMIVIGVGAGAYFISSAKRAAGPDSNEPTAADAKKCAAPDADNEAAIVACTRLLERSGVDRTSSANYYSSRGWALFNQGYYERALKDLTEALTLNPNAAPAHAYRGIAYFYKHDLDHAVADLKRALQLDAKDARSEYYLAHSLQGLGQIDEALVHLNNAISLDAKNDDFHRLRGDILAHEGNYTGAISDYSEAIRLNSKSGSAFRGRGSVHLKQGDVEEAVADLTRAIDLDRSDWYARQLRGAAYMRARDYAKAANDATEALRLRPNSAEILTVRADALLKMNKIADAMSDINRALSISTDFAPALTTRGEIYEMMDRTADAIADFKRALAIDGTNEEAKKGLARLEQASQNTPW